MLGLESFFSPATLGFMQMFKPSMCLACSRGTTLKQSLRVVCYPTVHQLPYNEGLWGPGKKLCPTAQCLLKNWKGNICLYYIFLCFCPLNDSKVTNVDFSYSASQSWIHAFSNTFCARPVHSCSEAFQTLSIYSSMHLNEGKAVEPCCSCLSRENSWSICQLVKSTYSF